MLDQLSLPKWRPIILYNGSVVVRNGVFDIIHKRTISPSCLKNILEISSSFNVSTLAYVYEDPTRPLFQTRESNEFVLGWSRESHPEREFNGMIVHWQNNFNEINFAPCAILIDISNNMDNDSLLESKLREVKSISFTHSGSSFIEVRPDGSNKGTALEFVAKYLNIRKEEVLAFGDNDNDAEMLKWASIGVAIAKASPSALFNSDYVSRYDVSRGAIELLRLIKHSRYYFFKPRIKLGERL